MMKNNHSSSNNNNNTGSHSTGSNNIFVTIRVRPETEEEINDRNTKTVVRVVDSNIITLDTVSPPSLRLRSNSQNDSEQRFIFDRVFDQYATQKEVFENTTKDVIQYVINGYNSTVFCYGATGAGKTHTMIGNEKSGPGVMVLTMRSLFEEVEKKNNKLKISMSYMEIYNENIYDLLVNDSKPLGLRADANSQVVVADLTERYPTSSSEVFLLLDMANANRKQSPTNVNKVSSRSHAILQIYVRSTNSTGAITNGKLSLIDLAGSERAARTMNRGVRLVEGANINKSLLSLGNCINALAGRPGQYIPYRDSKLTRILKDSLGGNCKTVMIANISPNSTSYEETHNTLLYANRAKDIKTRVEKNVLNVNTHLGQYTEIIKELREEIRNLKHKLSDKDNIADNSLNSSSSLLDSTFDESYVNQISDEINENLQDTLNLKKNLSFYEDQVEQIQSIMNQHRAVINIHLESGDPEKIEQAKPLKEEYLQKKQELLTIESKLSEIQMELNEKDTWRKKLQLDLPSNIKCQKYQNYLIQQARAASLELDRWDISDKFLRQNKSQQERLNDMAQMEKEHSGAIDSIYNCLVEAWGIINNNLAVSNIPVEFVNNFLTCSRLRNKYLITEVAKRKLKQQHQQQQHQQLHSSFNEDQQQQLRQNHQQQQPLHPQRIQQQQLHSSFNEEQQHQQIQQPQQPTQKPKALKSIIKKPAVPIASTTSTTVVSKKRVLEQEENSMIPEVQTPKFKKPAIQTKAGSRTIFEAIQVPSTNETITSKPVRQLRPIGVASQPSSSVQLKRIQNNNNSLQTSPPTQTNNYAQPTKTTTSRIIQQQQQQPPPSITTNGNTAVVRRVKFQSPVSDENQPPPPTTNENMIEHSKTLKPLKTRIVITKKVPSSTLNVPRKVKV